MIFYTRINTTTGIFGYGACANYKVTRKGKVKSYNTTGHETKAVAKELVMLFLTDCGRYKAREVKAF